MSEPNSHFIAVCPNCLNTLRISTAYSGQNVRCKHCDHKFRALEPDFSEPPTSGQYEVGMVAEPPRDDDRMAAVCPGCDTTLSVRRSYAGHHVRCSKCGQKFLVPSIVEPTAAPSQSGARPEVEKDLFDQLYFAPKPPQEEVERRPEPSGTEISSAEIQVLEAERNRLHVDLGRLREDHDRLQSERDRISVELDELRAEHDQLDQLLAQSRQEQHHLGTELAAIKEALGPLRPDEIGPLRQDRDALQAESERLSHELQTLRNQLSSQGETARLVAQRDEELRLALTQSEQLTRQVQELEDTLRQRDQLAQQLQAERDEHALKIQQLETDAQNARGERDQLAQQLQTERDELNQRLQQIQEQLDDSLRQRDQLAQQLQTERDEHALKIQQLETDAHNARGERDQLAQQLQTERDEINQRLHQIQEQLEDTLRQRDQLAQQLQTQHEEHEQLVRALAVHDQTTTELRAALETVQTERDSLTEQIRERDETLSRLSAEKEHLEAAREMALTEVEQLRMAFDRREQEDREACDQRKAEVAELRRALDDTGRAHRESLDQLTEELRQARERCEFAESQLKSQQVRNQELLEAQTRFKADFQAALETERARQAQQLDEIQAKYRETTDQVERLKAEILTLAEARSAPGADLNAARLQAEEFRRQLQESERTRRQMSDLLEGMGIRFH